MRRALIVLLPLLAIGCAEIFEDPPPPDYTALDDQQCQSMGLQFGTDGYADCRMRLIEMREERARALAGWLMTNPIGANPRPPKTTTTCRNIYGTITCETQ